MQVSGKVLDKFTELIAGDPDLLGATSQRLPVGVEVGGGRCTFTIAALYQWVKDDADGDYRAFRAQLYQGALNQDLARVGYTVEVARSSGNVDSSHYQLVKL